MGCGKLLNSFIDLGTEFGGDRDWNWVCFGVWSLLRHLDDDMLVQLQISNHEHQGRLCGVSLSTSIPM